jgi:hypothetical protein
MCVRMYFFEDLTQAEIATAIHRAPCLVSQRITSSLRKMRLVLRLRASLPPRDRPVELRAKAASA